MMTFLPYPSYAQSARVLDYRRLGKQRLEALWLINHIINGTSTRHILYKMWSPYLESLKEYHNAMVTEWVIRGYRNTMLLYRIDLEVLREPQWLGDPLIHGSHRGRLLAKDQGFYSGYGWNDQPVDDYYYPQL